MHIKHVCIEFEIYVLSCQVYITFSDNVPIDYDIEIDVKSITITLAEKDIYILNIKEYTLEEDEVRDIKVYGNKLLFRAQLNSCPKTESSCFSFVPKYMPEVKSAEEVFITCCSCQKLFNTKSFNFRRVLPVELYEVDHMFCHGGTDNLVFHPQEDDCYFDKVSIYIRNKHWTSSNSVKCKNCNLCLGVCVEYGLRLWLDSVSFKFGSNDEQTYAPPYDCFAILIDDIVKTMLGPISHVIMKFKDSENAFHYILMKVIKKSEFAIALNPNCNNILTLERKNCSSIIWHTSADFVEKWRNEYFVTEIQISERMYHSAIKYLTEIHKQFLIGNCLTGIEKSRKSYLFTDLTNIVE